MKLQFALASAAIVAFATPVRAQEIDSQCPPGTLSGDGKPDNTMVAQDACQKAIDLFKYMAPQLGLVLAGGNPTQGVSGALGKGHFSIGIRANGLSGSLPEVDRVVPNTRGAQQSNYTLDTKPIGYVMADVSVGVYESENSRGFGALDLMLSVSYIPEYSNGTIDVSLPSSSFKLGYGAKLGILKESVTRPGVSVSYLTRSLPRVTITGTSGDDQLLLEDVSVKAKTWRIVAGKSFRFIGFGAGYGGDSYDSDGRITVTVAPRAATQGGVGGPIDLSQKISRRNLFGSAWVGSQNLRIVGEFGRVSGGDIVTYNLFSGVQPADTRNYVSLGLSFGR
jgi:hypothetical protein